MVDACGKVADHGGAEPVVLDREREEVAGDVLGDGKIGPNLSAQLLLDDPRLVPRGSRSQRRDEQRAQRDHDVYAEVTEHLASCAEPWRRAAAPRAGPIRRRGVSKEIERGLDGVRLLHLAALARNRTRSFAVVIIRPACSRRSAAVMSNIFRNLNVGSTPKAIARAGALPGGGDDSQYRRNASGPLGLGALSEGLLTSAPFVAFGRRA